MAKKYYAVKKGKTPGIYYTWEDCRRQVEGFPGAIYKGFSTVGEAERFIESGMSKGGAEAFPGAAFGEGMDSPYSYVDGSYNSQTGVYGYGGFLVAYEKRYELQGCGSDPELAAMRNVAGEVAGSMAAMKKALELGLKELTIYYDYMGIEMWASGAWKRNKRGTMDYYDYVQSIQDRLKLSFVKVKGHSGIEGNEQADRLAKEAVGIESAD